jgi:hypothetical protein
VERDVRGKRVAEDRVACVLHVTNRGGRGSRGAASTSPCSFNLPSAAGRDSRSRSAPLIPLKGGEPPRPFATRQPLPGGRARTARGGSTTGAAGRAPAGRRTGVSARANRRRARPDEASNAGGQSRCGRANYICKLGIQFARSVQPSVQGAGPGLSRHRSFRASQQEGKPGGAARWRGGAVDGRPAVATGAYFAAVVLRGAAHGGRIWRCGPDAAGQGGGARSVASRRLASRAVGRRALVRIARLRWEGSRADVPARGGVRCRARQRAAGDIYSRPGGGNIFFARLIVRVRGG